VVHQSTCFCQSLISQLPAGPEKNTVPQKTRKDMLSAKKMIQRPVFHFSTREKEIL
jgi:hypothetical protein